MKMDVLTARIFVFLDEWCWIILCVYLLHRWVTTLARNYSDGPVSSNVMRNAFWTAFLVGAIMIYGIAYPIFWWRFGL